MADSENLFRELEEKYGFPEGKFVNNARFEVLAKHSTSQLKATAAIPKEHDGHEAYIAMDKQSVLPVPQLPVSI